MKLSHRESRPKSPRLLYQADPIRDSLKVLGRKWTLLILRDVAFLKIRRFGEMRQNNPGLTARVLSRRLRQMTDEGLVRRRESGRAVYYDLASRGEDAVYVLLALLRYGIRHHMTSGGTHDQDDVIKKLHHDLPVKN